jgi:hypothetical protein
MSTSFHIRPGPWNMNTFSPFFYKYCQMNASLDRWDALAANLSTANYITDTYASWICIQSLGILKHERVLTKHLKTSRQWKVSVERLIDILRKQLKLGIQSLQSCTSIFTKILNSAGVAITIVRANPGKMLQKAKETRNYDTRYSWCGQKIH